MSAVAPPAALPCSEQGAAGSEPVARTTPLHEAHVALGAVLTPFAGWTMPLRYGSELAEHHAVRGAAGLFDLSHMGQLEIDGADAAALLDHALVGRLSAVQPGRARYTMICAPDGGILDDLVVYRLEPHRYLVVANAANTAAVFTALTERAAGFAAEVRDVSARWALIAVQGPRAAAILAPLTGADLGSLRYYAVDPAWLAGRPVLLARTGYTGEDGFEIYCAPEDAPGIWAAVAAAGTPHGLVPAGLACRDTLRLEAGMPLYGNELTARVSPYEAGLGRVVALDKPDFVGRAALAARREQATEVLVGLVSGGRRAPRHDYAVLDPDTGARVGTVTSGAPSPTLGRPIAMAYVAADRSATGTVLAVDVRGSRETVTVVELPFYRRTQEGR
ncbi:glycine cleavage system aminomethyltransferase GcvT [Catellatospora sp. KI3]|uniref:glycine cleavage system aminomethyltransferase GcvT n=1 Tax=Catellatospora sp. KI3 TaxID=3041620 RepID=UPI0024826D36|nr:glycine cleavage system aminomethyltransferase GcvT [Catellatospora sp. KI3]MDI1464028.1 glycine cleavage system aminomethyltransferase GcvT [Catellatospora sp. KI3]